METWKSNLLLAYAGKSFNQFNGFLDKKGIVKITNLNNVEERCIMPWKIAVNLRKEIFSSPLVQRHKVCYYCLKSSWNADKNERKKCSRRIESKSETRNFSYIHKNLSNRRSTLCIRPSFPATRPTLSKVSPVILAISLSDRSPPLLFPCRPLCTQKLDKGRKYFSTPQSPFYLFTHFVCFLYIQMNLGYIPYWIITIKYL